MSETQETPKPRKRLSSREMAPEVNGIKFPVEYDISIDAFVLVTNEILDEKRPGVGALIRFLLAVRKAESDYRAEIAAAYADRPRAERIVIQPDYPEGHPLWKPETD